MLYFWLYSNRILTAKVLFNILLFCFIVLDFIIIFLKDKGGYFAPFPPLRNNAFKKLLLD
ncbi:hypothetical protein EXS88_04965 [Helicobacter pylori]|nr:hypothetical protein EPC79_05000 [Helicobacter pylori]KAA6500077.1 hypothetical protein EPC72_03135 [Helicobacter pylori]KAA6511298.1 hypothetical protein EPC74_03960 [Helicobacter pylori]NHB45523.1 hypothetical protein [Helicobacter pylori]NHB51381.1 hypothetical protein [Helicobacter pylori]